MTEFIGIQRSNTMPDIGIGPVIPDGQEVPDAQDNHVVAEVKHDPAIQRAMVRGVGPDLQNGNGQAVQFAAQHHASPGRDWDMNSATGMLETAQKAVAKIKKDVAGAEKLSEFERTVTETIKQVSDAHPQGEADGLQKSCTEFKTILNELKQARAALTAAIKDGSGAGGDPRKGLDEILKTLRVFRYEMQVELGKKGLEIGKMDAYEGALREIQHAFTFKVGSKVPETLFTVMLLENQLNSKLGEINGKLSAIAPNTPPVQAPNGLWLADTIGDVLELSHRTNDQIRDFQDTDRATATLRDIVGGIALKGGSRKVELSIGVGALIGLGFSSAAVAGLRVGARVRVIGEVKCEGKGRPISVTFRIAGGAEAKAAIAELDLKLGEITYVEDASLKEDTVISQSPTPGMALAEGDTIDLVVSMEPVVVEPPAPEVRSVAVWIDYSPAVNEDFTMTVTVSDSVSNPRTPLSQAERHKSDSGESFAATGAGPDGKVLVFFDNALVYEYDVNFETGEIH